MTSDIFHSGELSAQALAGIATPSAAIRSWMPDQHRAFFGLLPFLPIATADAEGTPVATILTGPPGFIASPDPTTLQVQTAIDLADPIAERLVPTAMVGLLGIDLATRRRNRANGVLRSVGPDGLTVSVEQSFGNCPRYIQTRLWHEATAQAGPVEHLSALDLRARAMIAGADTLFVASTSARVENGGMDISHRGGRPGFVAVAGDTLIVPDFNGNGYFNTLGNLLQDPRAALLFVDWSDGTLLHVQGVVEIQWHDDADFVGAERIWRLEVTGAWRRPNALPLRWSLQDVSPHTARTGTWLVDGQAAT